MKEIMLGLMRLGELNEEEAISYLEEAYQLGYRSFDLADIYCKRESERLFGLFMKKHPEIRKDIFIQTKCGIDTVNRCYNFSKEYIISHIEESLRLLNVDYLDSFLLHRPDILVDYKELKETFNYLLDKGLTKSIGVSNMNVWQIETIEKFTGFKMAYNQVELSIVHNYLVTDGVFYNNKHDFTTFGMIEYAQINGIKLQAWSVMLDSNWTCFIDNPDYKELNDYLEVLANKYNTTKGAIAINFILKHPANITPIIGTTNKKRLKESLMALEFEITREEYYNLLKSTGIVLP